MAADYASNVRWRTSVFITVTKEVRPKQSIDMNEKAWDNKGAAYELPFRLLLVLKVRGRLRAGKTGVVELSGSLVSPLCRKRCLGACQIQE